jgi:hypothetical protein
VLDPGRLVRLAVTPGGRVGVVVRRYPARRGRGPRIRVRYLDDGDEVILPEHLPGIRMLPLTVRELFPVEAAQFDRDVAEKRRATARDCMRRLRRERR